MSVLPFPRVCQLHGLPPPVPEYRFALPRRWRFDWAWVPQLVALEVQGSLFAQTPGRHARGAALRKEHEKLNRAAGLGWRVLYVMPENLESSETLDAIRLALVTSMKGVA